MPNQPAAPDPDPRHPLNHPMPWPADYLELRPSHTTPLADIRQRDSRVPGRSNFTRVGDEGGRNRPKRS